MDREAELVTDNLPLEEVLVSEIDGLAAPVNWSKTGTDESHEFPPVLIREDRGYSLVGNHRTIWNFTSSGRSLVKCLVVRSTVHVIPAHNLIRNCTEEAMLFEGLLRREIVPNRSKLADMLGYSRARITQLLNLLKLPKDIRQKVLLTDEISEFQLRQLLKVVDDPDKLHEGFQALLDKKLSGRQMAIYTSEEHPPLISDITPDEPEQVDIPVKADDSVSELEDMFTAEESSPEPDLDSAEEPAQEIVEKVEPQPDRKSRVRKDMVQVLRNLGNLRDSSWRNRAAAESLSPQDIEFLEGVAHMRTGLYRRAMEVLEEVVAEDSENHLGWFYLGRCANLTGQLPEAEEYLRHAVSREPENPDYIVELAIVLEKLKRHSEAEGFYRKSASIRKSLVSGK